jgi:hypothetical protein
MSRELAATLALLLCLSSAHAARNSEQRVQAFAALPDWTGFWESKVATGFRGPSGHLEGASDSEELAPAQIVVGHPPLNAQWEQKFQAAMDPAAIANAAGAGKLCDATFPLKMDWAGMFQAVVTPEETLFIFDTGGVRHIYTDGRSHPAKDDLWPTPMGDSIGHWQGETLVIDTVARTAGPIGVGPNDLSERAHFTEHVRRIDKNTFEDLLTIDDPLRFTRPWKLTIRYSRVTDLNRMLPTDCEHDRNPVVNGRLTVQPR